jgi:hypothetical protein
MADLLSNDCVKLSVPEVEKKHSSRLPSTSIESSSSMALTNSPLFLDSASALKGGKGSFHSGDGNLPITRKGEQPPNTNPK